MKRELPGAGQALGKPALSKVQEATIARIIGHRHREITFARYGGKSDPETLRLLMNKLTYELDAPLV